MSYDDERLVKIVNAAREKLEELGLTLEFSQLAIDPRTDEELMGTSRKHSLQLQIGWDGTLPEALMPDPNAAAGDDFELSEEERALFDQLEHVGVKEEDVDDDDRHWNAEQAVRDAEAEDIAARFLDLKKKFGTDGDAS